MAAPDHKDDDEHGHGHDHDHDHDHDHEASELSALELRVRALETVLTQKGYVDPEALDVLIDAYSTKIGPRNGALVVARAWCDGDFRQRLLEDATAAIASLGFMGRQGEHMVAVENTADEHNMVVCTLCSCYPWPVLGLPPTWYKSAPYRARAVKDPRGVLEDFGVPLPASVRIRVWDSTSEVRYLVLPQRPAGSEHLSEHELAELVTRDSMIGTGLPLAPRRCNGERHDVNHDSHADLGGQDGHGAVRHESESEALHTDWERRVLALALSMGATGLWNIDMSRAARETLEDYGELSYYQVWLAGLEKLLLQSGAVDAEELAQGRQIDAAIPVARVLHAGEVAAALARGTPTLRSPNRPARYAVGQWVRTCDIAPPHHTRLPGYARGKRGVIERIHGMHVFADKHAQGLGEQPQWLYTVTFDEQELWGQRTPPQCSRVSVDAWEPYSEAG